MKTPLLVLIIIYLIMPMLAGTLGSTRDKKLKSASKEKKATFKLGRYKNVFRSKNLMRIGVAVLSYLKRADRLERTGFLLIAVISMMYVAMGLSALGIPLNNKIRIALLILVTILPVIFFTQKFKIITLIKINYTWIKWIIGFITLTGAYLIGIYTDFEIVYLTKSKADNFPNAQKALTFIFTLAALWATAVIIGLIAYGLQFLNLMRIFLIETFKIDEFIEKIIYKETSKEKLNAYTKPKKKIHMRHEMTLFLGLCLFTVLSIAAFDNYAQKGTIDFDLKKIIVLTSFHADADACGFPDDKNVSIAILPMSRMIAATHLANGDYTFEPGECRPPFFKPKQKPNLSIFRVSL
ncbi:hypothetical protein [Pseudomonas syringae]|uniref:hypothetical protein n=1 Tax=Pseudomonas syringae TaxID=317 RepID=UPI003F843A14